jgi:methylmalonyl-CoA mutase
VRYLSEIAENNRQYDNWVIEQSAIATRLYQVTGAIEALKAAGTSTATQELEKIKKQLEEQLDADCKNLLATMA